MATLNDELADIRLQLHNAFFKEDQLLVSRF